MIAVEFVLAVYLWRRLRPVHTARTCALLHIGFAAWAAIALLRGLHIPNCGCFGVFLARPLGWYTVLEDGVVVCVSLLLAWLVRPQEHPRRQGKQDGSGYRRIEIPASR
jgi:hypothetical protein